MQPTKRSADRMPAWFERKFVFTVPPGHFLNVCIRLRGTQARLEETLRGLPHAMLVQKPEENKWSAQEHAGHLLDLEPLWQDRTDDFLAGRDTLTVADLSNRKTHEANHNARPLTEILTVFRATRISWVDRLATLKPDLFARSLFHPRLKQPMRLVDHLYFVAEHDDHHIARIRELMNPAAR